MTIADIERAADVPVGGVAERLAAVEARLHGLAQDVEELKRELRRARTERLEGLTLVVDLLTTSWQAGDRRPGRTHPPPARPARVPGPRPPPPPPPAD